MLVLNRKVGEKIAVGDGIVITLVSVRGRHARIGIEAPDDVSLRRMTERGELEGWDKDKTTRGV